MSSKISPGLNRNTKVLPVMDVVESVRLMELDADDFVVRWQKLVQQAEQQILPLPLRVRLVVAPP